jgi:hypothetical protein
LDLVEDLQARITSLEIAREQTLTDNQRLKLDLKRASTVNEFLRRAQPKVFSSDSQMRYVPEDFYTDVLATHDNKTSSHRVAILTSGERCLAAGTAWDFIIGHELYKRGLVDVADICNRLKGHAKCDGEGPVFEEHAILHAIEKSAFSADSLL